MSNPKISLINCIETPPNSPSKNTLLIADSGANIQQEKQGATKMSPVIISNDMTKRLIDEITLESSKIATLQISGPIKQACQIHILQ